MILITGYPDENISARAAAAGGHQDVILKPLLDESLVKPHPRCAIQRVPRPLIYGVILR